MSGTHDSEEFLRFVQIQKAFAGLTLPFPAEFDPAAESTVEETRVFCIERTQSLVDCAILQGAQVTEHIKIGAIREGVCRIVTAFARKVFELHFQSVWTEAGARKVVAAFLHRIQRELFANLGLVAEEPSLLRPERFDVVLENLIEKQQLDRAKEAYMASTIEPQPRDAIFWEEIASQFKANRYANVDASWGEDACYGNFWRVHGLGEEHVDTFENLANEAAIELGYPYDECAVDRWLDHVRAFKKNLKYFHDGTQTDILGDRINSGVLEKVFAASEDYSHHLMMSARAMTKRVVQDANLSSLTDAAFNANGKESAGTAPALVRLNVVSIDPSEIVSDGMDSVQSSRPPVAPTAIKKRSRLSNSIESHSAANRMEKYWKDKGIRQSDFAVRTTIAERTLRSFRRSGKISHGNFEAIAKEMNLSKEELLNS